MTDKEYFELQGKYSEVCSRMCQILRERDHAWRDLDEAKKTISEKEKRLMLQAGKIEQLERELKYANYMAEMAHKATTATVKKLNAAEKRHERRKGTITELCVINRELEKQIVALRNENDVFLDRLNAAEDENHAMHHRIKKLEGKKDE